MDVLVHAHFNSALSLTHTHRYKHAHADQHSVKLWLQFDANSPVSSLVLVRDVPSPPTKTNTIHTDESINQSRRLPIVMFHSPLMHIESLWTFPIMQGKRSVSTPLRTLLIDESTERDRSLSKQELPLTDDALPPSMDGWASQQNTTLYKCFC